MQFRQGETVAELARAAVSSPELPFEEDEEFDVECGLWCAGDDES